MTLRGLDTAAITRWLAERVDIRPPVTFDVISGGHSNITAMLTDVDGRRLILRRPPVGDVPDGAHDVLREHRIMSALAASRVPVPEPVTACDDPSVTGAPFAVTQFVEGFVVATVADAHSVLTAPDSRAHAGSQLIDVLADLHRVDVEEVGLGDISIRRGRSWAHRQIDRYLRIWQRTATRDLPEIDVLASRLRQSCPTEARRCLIHSDYRLGNVMVTRPGSIIAVLDWELASVGDPLADVGFLLANWHEPGDQLPALWMTPPPTLAGGFPGRQQLVDRYAAATGWDVGDVPFFRSLAYWRVAVLAEGIKRRYQSAAMASTRTDTDHLDQRVIDLVAVAHRALDER